MSKLRQVPQLIYWLAVGYIPIAMFRSVREYEVAIGCPAQGDCYVLGSEHILSFDIVFLYAAILLLPLAAWKIIQSAKALISATP